MAEGHFLHNVKRRQHSLSSLIVVSCHLLSLLDPGHQENSVF